MDRPDFVAAERYYDPAFATLENQRLWPRAWQMACRLEEIPAPGDYVEYTVADQSVLLVRVDGDEVKAYLNACRHRATQLATGAGTFDRGRIICPFHGWSWNLEGENTFVYGAHTFDPTLLTPEELCLREARVEIWGACAWINLDPTGATPARGPGSHAQPAGSPRGGRHADRLVEGSRPPGQLEAGPGGLLGGLPRTPDPPPADPRAP